MTFLIIFLICWYIDEKVDELRLSNLRKTDGRR